MTDYDHALAWFEADRWWYRASAFGGCAIAMAAAREGVTAAGTVPEAMQKVFDEGKHAERAIIDKFTATTGMDYSESVDTWYLELGSVGVAGHVDGFVWGGGVTPEHVIEVKFLGDALWAEWQRTFEPGGIGEWPVDLGWPEGKLWEKYAWQESCYHHATDKPVVFVVAHKELDGHGNRVVGEVTWKWLDVPLKSRVEMLLRAREIDGTVAGTCAVGDYPCGYYFLHEKVGDQAAADGKDIVLLDSEELANLIETYEIAQSEAKATKKNADAVKKELTELMEKMDLTTKGRVGRCGDWQVEWIEQETSEYMTKAGVRSWPKVSRNPVAMPDSPFDGLPGKNAT